MESIPQVIGNCKIVGRIGAGGMGSVYRAVHNTLGRHIALKIMPAEFTRNPEYVSRFMREAKAVASLNHPNIVGIHDAGEQYGIYYISMELIDGASLAGVLRKKGPMPEAAVLDLMIQAAKGLGAAHKQGLIHRDIKPENMLINKDGMLKIVDFGLVMDSDSQSHLTRTGTFLGTPAYMSPEQCEGEQADARSDLYSIGGTMYALLTGHPPFTAPTALGLLYKHKFEAPENPKKHVPALTDETANAVLKLLSKERKDRYQNALDLVRDLQRAQKTCPELNADFSLEKLMEGFSVPSDPISPDQFISPATQSSGARGSTMAMGSSGAQNQGDTATMVGQTPSPGSQNKSSSSALASGTEMTVLAPGRSTPAPGSAPNATPAPGPLPGIGTSIGTLPPKSKTGLIVAAAAIILIAVGGFVFMSQQSEKEKLRKESISRIQQLKKDDKLDEAKQMGYELQAQYPGDAQISRLIDEINQSIQEKKIKDTLKVRTSSEIYNENTGNIKELTQKHDWDNALKLCNEILRLPDLNAQQKEEASRLNKELNLNRLRDLSLKFEQEKKWEDALKHAREAHQTGGDSELPRVIWLENRVKIETVRTEAELFSKNNDFEKSAQTYERAGNLADPKTDANLVLEFKTLARDQRINGLLANAKTFEDLKDWDQAVIVLTSAKDLDPSNKTTKKRLKEANAQRVKGSTFVAQMKLGQDLLGKGDYMRARSEFEAALVYEDENPDALNKITECQARSLGAQASTALSGNRWTKARELFTQAQSAQGKLELADLKQSISTGLSSIEKNLTEIAQKEKTAEAGENAEDLGPSVETYSGLLAQNPDRAEFYQTRLEKIRPEHLFRSNVKAGDDNIKKSDFGAARLSYDEANKARTDDEAKSKIAFKKNLADAAEYNFKGQAALKIKDWVEAGKNFESAKQSKLDNTDALVAQLSQDIQKGFDAAQSTLKKIKQLEDAGETAVENKKWADADKAYDQLIELYPLKKAAYTTEKENIQKHIQYDSLVAEADGLLKKEDFQGALDKMKEADKTLPSQVETQTKRQQIITAQKLAAEKKIYNENFPLIVSQVEKGQYTEATAQASTLAQNNQLYKEFSSLKSAVERFAPAAQAVSSARNVLKEAEGICNGTAVRSTSFPGLSSIGPDHDAKINVAKKSLKDGNSAAAQASVMAVSVGVIEDSKKVLGQIVKTMEDKISELRQAPAHGEKALNVGELDVGAGGAQGDPKKNEQEIARYQNAINRIKGLYGRL